jgi:hypothetical protein
VIILGSDTVTILRGAGRDAWGDRSGSGTGTDVAGCLVQPGASTESTDQGDLLVTSLTVFLPGGTDITATDRISWQGAVYEVNGSPNAWHDQGAAESHVEAQLKLVEGSD